LEEGGILSNEFADGVETWITAKALQPSSCTASSRALGTRASKRVACDATACTSRLLLLSELEDENKQSIKETA
jgi:hypothetical protein